MVWWTPSQTWLAVVVIATEIGLFDFIVWCTAGAASTISSVIYAKSIQYPLLVIVYGIGAGHLFFHSAPFGPVVDGTVKTVGLLVFGCLLGIYIGPILSAIARLEI